LKKSANQGDSESCLTLSCLYNVSDDNYDYKCTPKRDINQGLYWLKKSNIGNKFYIDEKGNIIYIIPYILFP
jgi:TPR repeat protein